MTIDATDKRLLNAIADGLPLTLNPYETVADELGLVEDDVLLRLQKLIDDGVISRFGVVWLIIAIRSPITVIRLSCDIEPIGPKSATGDVLRNVPALGRCPLQQH